MSDWRELRAALEGIEVVDAHEHHRGGGDAVPLTAVVPFLCDNYLWGVLPFHVRDAQARIRGGGGRSGPIRGFGRLLARHSQYRPCPDRGRYPGAAGGARGRKAGKL